MRLLLTLLFTVALQTAHAQCCPYLQPVQILPANPTAADQVRLVFIASTPNRGNRVSTSFVRSGNTLTFTGCYYSGFLTQPQGFVDTVHVGRLPAGGYTINFVAQLSSSPQQCVEQQRNSSSTAAQVSQALAVRAPQPGWALYPVPTAGRRLSFTATTGETVSTFQLLDAAGRTCHAGSAANVARAGAGWELTLPTALPAGVYALKLHLTSGEVLARRVVLL